jgi:hypothetical protein
MRLTRNLSISATCILACFAFASRPARADIYTYSLSAPTGNFVGGTIGGTITVVGNPGDPFLDLPAATSFAFTYTPVAGPPLVWTQAGTITTNYDATVDFGSYTLGAPILYAQTPASGTYFWTVENTDGTKFNLFWSAAPDGPSWIIDTTTERIDAAAGVWTLNLVSDVVPEPQIAGMGLALGALLLLCGRSRKNVRRVLA